MKRYARLVFEIILQALTERNAYVGKLFSFYFPAKISANYSRKEIGKEAAGMRCLSKKEPMEAAGNIQVITNSGIVNNKIKDKKLFIFR